MRISDWSSDVCSSDLVTQLDNFFKTRGLPASKQQQCLTDKTALEKLAAIRGDAVKTYKLTGTPTFVLNGVTQENVFDWKGIRSDENASELQSLMRNSYAVFRLKEKKQHNSTPH